MAVEGLAIGFAQSHRIALCAGPRAQLVSGRQDFLPADGEGVHRRAMAPGEGGALHVPRDPCQRVVVRRSTGLGQLVMPQVAGDAPAFPDVFPPILPVAHGHVIERRLLGHGPRPALRQPGPDLPRPGQAPPGRCPPACRRRPAPMRSRSPTTISSGDAVRSSSVSRLTVTVTRSILAVSSVVRRANLRSRIRCESARASARVREHHARLLRVLFCVAVPVVDKGLESPLLVVAKMEATSFVLGLDEHGNARMLSAVARGRRPAFRPATGSRWPSLPRRGRSFQHRALPGDQVLPAC